MTVMKTSASTVVNSTQASSPRGVGEKGRERGELFPSPPPSGPPCLHAKQQHTNWDMVFS